MSPALSIAAFVCLYCIGLVRSYILQLGHIVLLTTAVDDVVAVGDNDAAAASVDEDLNVVV
jgi:hypothetical protein